MILVDTSVWIDFLTGKESLHRRLLHQFIEREEDICLSEIILTEILQGIRDNSIYASTKGYLFEFPIIRPCSTGTYLEAAEIYRSCRKKGKTIRKTIDCIIAAIVRENRFTLLHNDADFEIIEKCVGLKTVTVK